MKPVMMMIEGLASKRWKMTTKMLRETVNESILQMHAQQTATKNRKTFWIQESRQYKVTEQRIRI